MTPHLLVFGPGYSARPFMERAKSEGWTVTASARSEDKADALHQEGFHALLIGSAAAQVPAHVTHILTSIAPARDGRGTDPVLDSMQDMLASLRFVDWIGYLSATNVYGDHGGAWVDEETRPAPTLARGKRRLAAEAAWNVLGCTLGARTHVFRLAGIYGPGRNQIRALKAGTARRIHKPGQMFSRIHQADIAQALWLAASGTVGSDIFNMADDEPLAPDEAVARVAYALGMEPPPVTAFEDADLSEMAQSFYRENKRVRNDRVKEKLELEFQYPSLDAALPDLIRAEMTGP